MTVIALQEQQQRTREKELEVRIVMNMHVHYSRHLYTQRLEVVQAYEQQQQRTREKEKEVSWNVHSANENAAWIVTLCTATRDGLCL